MFEIDGFRVWDQKKPEEMDVSFHYGKKWVKGVSNYKNAGQGYRTEMAAETSR
jgi:hypothetical protein